MCSLNVRGLGDRLKRREMFNWLRKKNYSIYMLQEVHCSENTISVWSAEWGYKTLFSCCTSARGGVAILFNNNFNFQLQRSYSDPNGRFIICDIIADNKCVTMAVLYAPNDDDPNFFLNFFDHLNDFKCDEVVIGGDFNLVLDLDIDKKGGLVKTHTESVKTLKDFCAQFDLLDAWRILNPDTRRYTWRRKRPEIHCRLDFFLVTQSLMCNITSANILTGYKTDHSLIEITVATHSNMRGPGFWKLNTSLLTEMDYINQIRAVIKETQEEYQNDTFVKYALMWEMIKLNIRKQSLKYSTIKKAKISRREEEIEKEINRLQCLIETSNMKEKDKEDTLNALDTKKSELEKIIEYRTKGSILRARCKWHNEGEKNTKYFLSLEKRHYNQGAISQLKLENETFVTTDKEILSECETFYNNLYSSNNGSQNERADKVFFKTQMEKRLDQTKQDTCEGLLTKTECLEALKNMECNKTPGSDGLPAEFYKVFWNDIADLFLKSLNYAHQIGQMSVTQRRGIIKLIPKKDAEPYFIKNWRPISLLNCDYKIAAKAIANRFKQVLPNLIDNDQTGFLKGRFIGENIRLIDSIIKYTAAKNIPGLLLFLDFEKAFDTVEWSFLNKTLQHYNFGPSAIQWIKLFYHNTESCILNNGWSSDFFKLERGVRQGCPLSPYLFILCVEILAETIRKNKNIKGITIIDGQEIKISQYADDTTLILDGSRVSFTTALQILSLFSEISGLHLNSRKTEALWIGANIGKEENLHPEKGFKWVKDKVRALGIWLSTKPETTIEANYSEKLAKVRNSLSCWELRRLTLLGKIVVLKSLIASQLVYILSPLPTNHSAINEINSMFFNFLWDGKGDKIKRDIMISDYNNGGLRMIDIKLFNKALKSSWITKYLDSENHGKWKLLFDLELQSFGGEEVFRGNLSKEDLLKQFKISDTFTSEILQIWTDIKFEANIYSIEQLKAQNLWQNSLIRVGNKPIHYKSWSSKGVRSVGHLLKDSTHFLSFEDFTERFNIKTNFLTFQGVISAIKALWKSNEENLHNITTNYQTFIDTFLKARQPNRLAYKTLVGKKQKNPVEAQRKWIADCRVETQENIDWDTVYRSSFLCTKISKLIVFQFKLLHRRLATNSFLTKINLKDNEQCTFCQNDTETLIHLFWTCSVSTLFWQDFKQWAVTRGELSNTINLTAYLVLGLNPNKNKRLDFYFLIARYFLWVCKTCNTLPKIENFSPFLLHYDTPRTNT